MSEYLDWNDSDAAADAPRVGALTSMVRDRSTAARVAEIDAELARLQSQAMAASGASFAPGVQAAPGGSFDPRIAERIAQLEEERATLAVGNTGELVGGAVGGVGGAVGGALAGSVFGPVGTAVGAILGGLVGSSAGVTAGTKYDVAKFNELAGAAEPVSEEQAAKLVRDRLVENAIWEGGTLLLFGGGRVLRVMGAKPAFKEVLRRFVGAEQTKQQVIEQIAVERARKRGAAAAKSGPTPQLGHELAERDVAAQVRANPTLHPDAGPRAVAVSPEYTAEQLARNSEGAVPTMGDLTGEATALERFSRNYRPDIYEDAGRRMERGAERVRRQTLDGLDTDQLPAADPLAAGNALQAAAERAEGTVKAGFTPIAQRVDALGVKVDMEPVAAHVEAVLRADKAAGRVNLKPGERTALENFLRAVVEPGKLPTMTTEAATDFLSGTKSIMRDTSIVDQPSAFFRKVLGDVNRLGQEAVDNAVDAVDPALRAEFTAARRAYGEAMGDLYSDAMAAIRRGNPEDAGRIIAANNNVTEVVQLRRALARIADPSGALPPKAGNAETEAIFRRLLSGYLEKSFQDVQSLADLPRKMQNPEFRKVYAAMTGNNPEARQMLEAAHRAAKTALESPSAHSRTPIGGLFVLVPGMIAKAIATADKGVINALARVAAYSRNAVRGQTMPAEIAKAVDRLTEFAHTHGMVPGGAAPDEPRFEAEAPAEAPVQDWEEDRHSDVQGNPAFEAGQRRGASFKEGTWTPPADIGQMRRDNRVAPAVQKERDAGALRILQDELRAALAAGKEGEARILREEIARWHRTGRRMQMMQDAFSI